VELIIGLAGILVTVAVFYAGRWYGRREARETAGRRLDLKAQLGAAIREGQSLITALDDLAVEAWVEKTEAVIRDALGDGEVAQFRSDAGYVFYSGSGLVRNSVQGRLRRLTELIERLDTITLRDR
jgi:hypothetical protein